MRETADAQLLRNYAENGDESAFREIVERHTDLVYSAAWRQVASTDLAKDVAQGVFVDLARKAKPVSERLSPHASLVGWLYRSTRFAVLTHLRDDRRRSSHERQAMEQLITDSGPAQDWESIRPLLDEAMAELSDDDREAVLLRYFKNNDFRAVGQALGTSDDAAQKRVSRAVERLREFFSKRGIAIGAAGLVLVISANAVQAAPIGLAAAISASAVLAGAAIQTSTAIVATKVIAMTTKQKVLVATFVVLVGVGAYEVLHASQSRNQTHGPQQAASVRQVAQLQPAAQGQPAVSPPAPVQPPQPPVDNFLTFDAGQKAVSVTNGTPQARFVFNVTNISSGKVIINWVQTSCGCTVAKLPSTPWKLAPKEGGQISATMNLAGTPPGNSKIKTLTINTDKGNKVLSVKATILAASPAPMTGADPAYSQKIALANGQPGNP